MEAYTFQINQHDQSARPLSSAPHTRNVLAQSVGSPSGGVEIHKLDMQALTVDACGLKRRVVLNDAGVPVETDLIADVWIATGPQPARVENRPDAYKICNKWIAGLSLVFGLLPGADPVGKSPTSTTGALRLGMSVRQMLKLIEWKPGEQPADVPPTEKRYDVDVLDPFTKRIMAAADQGPGGQSSVLRFVAKDVHGNVAAAQNLKAYQWLEARRFVLDAYDLRQTCYLDLCLRAPVKRGDTSESDPIGRFASISKTERGADLSVTVLGEKPFYIKVHTPLAEMGKGEIQSIPVAGVTLFGKDGRRQFISWEDLSGDGVESQA